MSNHSALSMTAGSFSKKRKPYDDGLGPTYNTQSCRECHQNVVTDGASQIAEHRTGHTVQRTFFESLAARSHPITCHDPDIVEHVVAVDELELSVWQRTPGRRLRRVRLRQHAHAQFETRSPPTARRGPGSCCPRRRWQRRRWPVWMEMPAPQSRSRLRVMLILNEMGITSPLFPINTSNGRFVDSARL